MKKLMAEIEMYNDYENLEMSIIETGNEYYSLKIGKTEITCGDYYDILDRVKQINREHGHTFL